jgi:surfeit locus 1 family protein
MRAWRAWLYAIAALSGITAAVALGFWQWGRGEQKTALAAAISERKGLAALDQSALAATKSAADLMHRTVALRGSWLAQHTVFLDNRQMQGRPGFYVVTPLRLAGSGTVVLVQRGWAPRNFVDRAQVPQVATPAGEVTLQGRIAPPPSKLYDLGAANQGLIRQNLDLAAFRRETGLALWDGSVVQLGAPSEGLLRDWPQAGSGAEKNYGYAFQWWAIAAVILSFYVWFQFIAPRRRAARA